MEGALQTVITLQADSENTTDKILFECLVPWNKSCDDRLPEPRSDSEVVYLGPSIRTCPLKYHVMFASGHAWNVHCNDMLPSPLVTFISAAEEDTISGLPVYKE